MKSFTHFKIAITVFTIFCIVNSVAKSQGVVISEETGVVAPHSSSIFDVQSTTKGLLIPRMTAAQRLAISTPANGLLVYDLTENQFFYYDAAATSWVKAVGPQGPQGFLSPGTALGNVPYWNGTQWVLSSNNLFHNGSKVGIGTNNPLGKLDIRLADGSDYINVQRIAAGYGPIMDLFGFSTAHRLRIEYLSSSVYNFSVNDANKHIAFNPSGYVGINTGILEPTQKLDINGNLRLRGHLFDYNNTSGINGQVLTRSTSGLVWANPAGNVSGNGVAGKVAYWENASNIASLPFMQLNLTNQSVEVTSKTVANDDDPIFEVRNKDGMIVFGVYQTGVRIYVDDTVDKTARGGFAVGGFTNQKSDKAGVDYLRVTPDSVRIYIDNNDGKTARGGFAVGGYTNQKGMQELFRVTPDSTRIYINDKSTKTARGGFAVGGFTNQKGDSDHFFNIETGNTYTIAVSEPRILWYPLKNAFLAGQVKIANVNDVGLNSMAIGYEAKAKGNRSQAMGYLTEALGDNSTAVGKQAKAEATNSFAFGEYAQARAIESYAFGQGAIAQGQRSFAIGSAGVDSLGQVTGATQATGDYAFALGMGAQSTHQGAFAIGVKAQALGQYAVAIGNETNASYWYANAIGYKATATAYAATAMGRLASATGASSTSIGWETKAIGGGSIALGAFAEAIGTVSASFGISTKAEGMYSTAIGRESHAKGSNSVAMGYRAETNGNNAVALGSSKADGESSTAMGHATMASGGYSIVGGRYSTASGLYSVSLGLDNTASGSSAFAGGRNVSVTGNSAAAFGHYTTAQSFASFVVGRYNIISGSSDAWNNYEPVFVIGNGANSSSRSNAMTVLKVGYVGIGIDAPTTQLHSTGGVRFEGVLAGTNTRILTVDNNGNLAYRDAGTWAAGSTNVTGSGTANYIPKWSAANTQTNSQIFDNGTNVGIGSATPAEKLQVNGNIRVIGNVLLRDAARSIGTQTNHDLYFITNSTNRLAISSAGNVGIGTITPGDHRLFVTHNGSTTTAAAAYIENTNALGISLIAQNLSYSSSDCTALIVNRGTGNILNLDAYGGSSTGWSRPFVFTNNGRLGIGNTSPAYQLQLSLNSAAKPTSNTWTIPSDVRLKDIKGEYKKGLSEILALQPIVFRYKADNPVGIKETNSDAFGFIAQDVQKIFPEAVTENEKGYLDFDIHPILIAQINAIKELNEKIEMQNKIIEELVNRN